MTTTLGFDIASAKKLASSVFVSKPSDAVQTADVYSKTVTNADNLFTPLKLSVDGIKNSVSPALDGLNKVQSIARKSSSFATDNSIFKLGANGSMSIDPKNLINGVMKLDSSLNNAIKGYLNTSIVKNLGTIVGTTVTLNNTLQTLKNTKATKAASLFTLLNTFTGTKINPKILDKGAANAVMGLVFGESAKNNIKGMWANFKKIDLYASIGLNVARSVAPLIIKYHDVDLLHEISQDANKYGLLEADSRLLYNLAAYYKMPKLATVEQLASIWAKLDEAANSLRPNWLYVSTPDGLAVDGELITYASHDFISLIRAYVQVNTTFNYVDTEVFAHELEPDYKFTYTASNTSLAAAQALYGLINNSSIAKITTKTQIQASFGLSK